MKWERIYALANKKLTRNLRSTDNLVFVSINATDCRLLAVSWQWRYFCVLFCWWLLRQCLPVSLFLNCILFHSSESLENNLNWLYFSTNVSNLGKRNEELRQLSSEQINYNRNIQINYHFSEKIIKFLFTTNIIQNIFK